MPVDVSTQQAGEKIVSLGTRNGIDMAIRCRSDKTLGKVIAKPDSADLHRRRPHRASAGLPR